MTPAAQAHRDKADEAWNTYQTLIANGHLVWAAVALAYSALHHIDTYIYDRGIQVGSHGTRQRIIANTPELMQIASNYDELYNHALNARYAVGITYTADFVQALQENQYAAIRDLIAQLVP